MEIIFDEIVPQYAIQLMQDVFGNHVRLVVPSTLHSTWSLTMLVLQVVQKMFEYGTAAQKGRLVNTMEGQVLGLSLQMYGCRVVQKVCAPHVSMYRGADRWVCQAIEYVNPDQQVMFVQELSPSVLRCVKDANGNYVSVFMRQN